MTKKLYLEDSQLYESEAKIISNLYDEESDLTTLKLDQTIFFPQSGGQPCDHGKINEFEVKHVSFDKENTTDIIHMIAGKVTLNLDDTVTLSVQKEHRQLYSRLHTAAHIIAGEAEKLSNGIIKYSKCNLQKLYLMFVHVNHESLDESNLIKNDLQRLCAQLVASNVKISETYHEQHGRQVQIGENNIFRCSGTHTALSMIGNINITAIKKKRDKIQGKKIDHLKVSFCLQ